MRTVTSVVLAAVLSLVPCTAAWAAGTLTAQGAARLPIAIHDHRVTVVIDDGFARVEIFQTFRNPNDADLEALYSSPLPRDAALSEVDVVWFLMCATGISGEVVPKEKARAVYEEERDSGNDAALAEKNDFKTFEFAVARVPAYGLVGIRVVYYQPVEVDTGVGRFVYPLREGGVDDSAATAFWTVSDEVQGEIIVDIELRSSVPVDDVRIAGFESEATVEKLGPGRFSTRLGRVKGRLAKDLVFYYRLADGLPGRLDLVAHRADPSKPGTFMLTLTPGVDLQPLTGGADYVFLLDVSGSMKTKLRPLAEGVKRALTEMKPGDRFRIVTFSNWATDVTGGYVDATPESVRSAIDAVQSLASQGSTNLYAGVATALAGLDGDRATSLVLVTDGVTNAGQLSPQAFESLIERYDVRVFGFVMGNSANWPLLELIAQASGGFATGVSADDDIVGQIVLAKSKITHEAMHDAELRISGDVKTFDASDELLGKVFRGQQVVFFGRYEKGGEATVELRARISGEDKTYRTTVRFPEVEASYPEIERLWALDRVKRVQGRARRGLMDPEEARATVRDLGVAYQLVTDETSMLVLTDEAFARHGVDRANAERVAAERQAQAVRIDEKKPVAANDPMFDQNAPHVGHGAIDPFAAVLALALAGVAIVLTTRRKAAVAS